MTTYHDVIRELHNPADLLGMAAEPLRYLLMADNAPLCMACAIWDGDRLVDELSEPCDPAWTPAYLMRLTERIQCDHCGEHVDPAGEYADYTIGAHFVPYLYDGEASHLSDEEQDAFDRFLSGCPAGSWDVLTDYPDEDVCEVTRLYATCHILRHYPNP